MTPRELILKMPIDASNLNHIAKSGQINGSLLITIENAMKEYAMALEDELFVERQLVKVKQKEKEMMAEQLKHVHNKAIDEAIEKIQIKVYNHPVNSDNVSTLDECIAVLESLKH